MHTIPYLTFRYPCPLLLPLVTKPLHCPSFLPLGYLSMQTIRCYGYHLLLGTQLANRWATIPYHTLPLTAPTMQKPCNLLKLYFTFIGQPSMPSTLYCPSESYLSITMPNMLAISMLPLTQREKLLN